MEFVGDMLNIVDKISKGQANKLDDEVIKFLEDNGYRPKRTKEYFRNLSNRLKQKGLMISVEAIHYSYEDNKDGTVMYRMPDFKIEFKKIPSRYKKRIKVYDEYNLFRKHTFEFNPGITVLIGRNGSGKTTLLGEIKDYLKNNSKPVFEYRNEDYEGKSRSEFVFYGKIDLLAQSMTNSEGQEIMFNFGNHVGKLGDFVRKHILRKSKEIFILLDGLDSGLSINSIDELIDLFENTIIKDCKKNNIDAYIIISANTFEFVRNQDCIFVSNASHMKFENYDDYREFILGKERK